MKLLATRSNMKLDAEPLVIDSHHSPGSYAEL
jgi:hypothetical protein